MNIDLDQFVPATRDNDGILSVWRESNTAHPVSVTIILQKEKRTNICITVSSCGEGGGCHTRTKLVHVHLDRLIVTFHDKTMHNALTTDYELRPPLPTITFELLLLQI